MTDFIQGKLYKCHYYLLVYPTKKIAETANESCSPSHTGAIFAANHWTKWLKCQVRYHKPGEIFLFLKECPDAYKTYLYVLFGEKQGWIISENWMNIKPVLR